VTTGETASADTSPAEGVQQIPLMIPVQEVPAATDARDKLLAAIGREAQHVADQHAGQASPVLEQLARAYALVTVGTTTANTPVPATRSSDSTYRVGVGIADITGPSPE